MIAEWLSKRFLLGFVLYNLYLRQCVIEADYLSAIADLRHQWLRNDETERERLADRQLEHSLTDEPVITATR